MASYKELIQQREALEQAIAAARQSEITLALNQVKALVADFGLTADDIFGSGAKLRVPKVSNKPSGKVAPKYRDPATGATWTGRGKAPKWIQDKDRASFLIV
ncbi:MAG: H-NS histone family protein [Burkholderiaceae bacterium]|jgi:DNA-binding protein H-NS|nr:H-NS histone family protein [Betaproteobacteria bacterium]MBP6645185.1 H-NS histone family protein [Burkholderiaceae bacterium]